MTGKSKIVRAPLLVETFPNIKEQYETDVDATRTTLISCSLFFSFLKKCSLTPCLKLLRVFDNFKHVGKLFHTVVVK